MAIKGKKIFQLYLDQENYELVKEYLDTRPGQGGMSALMDKHLERCAKIVKNNRNLFGEIEPGKMTVKKFFQFLKTEI